MPVNSIFAQGVNDRDVFPEEPRMPCSDYWQDGYDYGFRLGKYYATSGQKETIVIYAGIDGNSRMKFVTVNRIAPLKDYYDAMSTAFYNAKVKNSGNYDMIRYYDGAINGLYDGFYLYIDSSWRPTGNPSPPKEVGDITVNPQEP